MRASSQTIATNVGWTARLFGAIRHPGVWFAAVAAALVWGGWGWWGMGVYGDPALDLTDALRYHQGDIPFRDYLPTYSVLHILLSGPLFALGTACFPTIWILTAMGILWQGWMIGRLIRSALPPFLFIASGGLFLSTVAFAPNNAKLMLGYSASGFLGTLLWTALLACWWRTPLDGRRWGFGGAILGLVLFTKIDLGLTAIACFLFLALVFFRRDPRGIFLCGGTVLLVGAMLTGWVLLQGGKWDLFWGATAECFGQVSLIRDPTLTRRFLLMAVWGAACLLLQVLPRTRSFWLRSEAKWIPWLLWLLPLALLVDAWRGWETGSLKRLLFFNQAMAFAGTMVGTRFAAAMIRRRSFFAAARLLPPRWGVLLVVSGMGLFRTAITGWYPLNYYQPPMLVLIVMWLGALSKRAEARAGMKTRRSSLILQTAWILALAASLAVAWRGCVEKKHPSLTVRTPFGSVVMIGEETLLRDVQTVLTKLADVSPEDRLLCTYEPSLQLLTGMRSSAFYTYFHRLAACGKYREQRERECEEFFRRHPPRFVLEQQGKAVFSRVFGPDYGAGIAALMASQYRQLPITRDLKLWERAAPDVPSRRIVPADFPSSQP
ncbi:MAG: hypothetical protein PHV34_08540 [Verrucomicrobiae bacterium]|nr:hypothetical protein [Verrucomicrobiae bacterium]